MGDGCGASGGTNVAPVVTERPLMGWLKDLWDTFILPSAVDIDHGDCDECGFPFTFDEWDARHTSYIGDVHAECCNGCKEDYWLTN